MHRNGGVTHKHHQCIHVGINRALILEVTSLHVVKEGQLRVGCDNEKCLYLSSLTNLKVPTKIKHADILRCIRIVRTALPLDITFEHIKAHQDDSILYHLLDRMSQLNVDCDTLAKVGLVRL